MDLTSLFERARAAGRELLQLPVGRVDEILRAVAMKLWHSRNTSCRRMRAIWSACLPITRCTTA